MSNTKRTIVKALGLAWGYFIIAVFLAIFSMAVLNGGQVVVDINRFGEAGAELLLLYLVVMPVVTVGLALVVEDAFGGSADSTAAPSAN